MPSLRLLLSFIVLLFLSYCSNDKSPSESNTERNVNTAFTGYISAYTSGVISNESTIIIDFNDPILESKPGEEIEMDLFEFSPSIEGKAVWISNQAIEFQPSELLPSDTKYIGEFFLSNIRENVPEELEIFKLQFQVMKQHLRVDYEGVRAYDPNDLSWQKIIGTLTTSDFAENAAVEKVLSASQSDNSLSITWSHQGKGQIHNFVVDSVIRAESK